MHKYYVYILVSSKDRHYIGYTSNLQQRIAQHNRKHKGFTGTTEFWEIDISIELPDKKSAIEMEKLLKSFKDTERAIKYLKDYQRKSTPSTNSGQVRFCGGGRWLAFGR
jgi:putative endonuclease